MSLSFLPLPTSDRIVRPLRFWCSLGEHTMHVTVIGELDLAAAPKLDAALQGAGADRGLVVVDLRGLDFMDSSGVHLLLAADRRIRRMGGRLVVVLRYGGDVEWLLALTGADRRLELTDQLPDLSAVRLSASASARRIRSRATRSADVGG